MTDIETGIEQTVQDAFTRAFTNFKGTFSFERKVSRGEYSNSDSSTAAVHVQFDYAPDATGEEFLEAAREAALKAKSLVFEQLAEHGIKAQYEDGVVSEIIQEAFPGAVTEQVTTQADPNDINPERTAAASAASSVAATPPHSDDAVKAASGEILKAMRKENATWAKARYESHPGEFKDQRPDNEKNGTNFPDFQHKKFWKAGFYLN